MHLADASIQSDLQLQSGYTFLNQYLCSLGIEATTFGAATQCSTTEPHRISIIIIIITYYNYISLLSFFIVLNVIYFCCWTILLKSNLTKLAK